jgi:hypothetical protein
LWGVFRDVFAKEDGICKRHLGQENTQLLDNAHKERKNACMGLKRTIEAAAYGGSTPALKAAADELTGILDNYPHIGHAPLTAASAMIVNLAQDAVRAYPLPQLPHRPIRSHL